MEPLLTDLEGLQATMDGEHTMGVAFLWRTPTGVAFLTLDYYDDPPKPPGHRIDGEPVLEADRVTITSPEGVRFVFEEASSLEAGQAFLAWLQWLGDRLIPQERDDMARLMADKLGIENA